MATLRRVCLLQAAREVKKKTLFEVFSHSILRNFHPKIMNVSLTKKIPANFCVSVSPLSTHLCTGNFRQRKRCLIFLEFNQRTNNAFNRLMWYIVRLMLESQSKSGGIDRVTVQ